MKPASSALLLLLAIPGFSGLRAGVARVDITPDVTVARVPLGGYTARGGNRATGVRDPVFARALVLDDGATRVALVSCDMLTVPASLKDAVVARLPGWDPRRVIIAATHTHSAPDSQRLNSKMLFPVPGIATFNRKALDWTAERVARAVALASKSLEGVSLRLGESEAGLSRLRRWGNVATDPGPSFGSPPWRWGPFGSTCEREPERPARDTLRVAELDRADGSVLALAVNYAAHPTIFDEKMLKISAEWPGELGRLWERRNPGAMLLFFNGALGDRSPIADEGKDSDERMRTYAAKLLAVVDRAEAGAKPAVADRLAVGYHVASLPAPVPHPELLEQIKRQAIPKPLLLKAMEGFVSREAPCAMLEVGGWRFLAVSGEPTTAVGEELRRIAPRGPDAGAFVVSFCDDWMGYILTPAQYKLGGYEATVSFHGPGLSGAILAGFRAAASSLR